MHYFFLITLALTTLAVQGCYTSSEPVTLMPVETNADAPVYEAIHKHLDFLHNFVDSLHGKSEHQIIRELGEPTTRDTWNYNGTKQPLFIYYLTNQSQRKLSLYFTSNEYVVRVVHGTLDISEH